MFLGKFGQRLDVLLVQRPEYDVHVLHLAFAQNGVQRGTFGARIVSVQVNGSAGTFQTVYGHQQAFVVFHHTGGLTLRYPVQKGEDDGSLDGAETLCLFSVFAEQLAVGRRGLQLRALLRLCLGVGDAEEGSLLYFVLAFQLRIGGNQLGFADAVFAADAEYGFFSFHLVHVAAARLYGPGILLLATTVLLLSVSVGAMVSASVVEGMRMTCPIRKFSALSPGLASQMALADTLYFTVSR